MRKRLPQKCVSIRVCRPALVRRETRRSPGHLFHRHFIGGTLGFKRQWSFFMQNTAGCGRGRDSGSVAQRCARSFQRIAMVECCSDQYATRYPSPFIRAKHLWQGSRELSTAQQPIRRCQSRCLRTQRVEHNPHQRPRLSSSRRDHHQCRCQ